MRTICFSDNPNDYEILFQELINTRDTVISWQLQEGERLIKKSKVSSVDLDSNVFATKIIGSENGDFKKDTVYFFIKNKNIIFKSSLLHTNDFLSFRLPQELKVLDDKETSEWIKNIDMEDLNVFVKGHGFANIPLETTRVRGEGRANINTSKSSHYSGANTTDHISTKWRITSMSKHDSEMFETELSFVSLDEEDLKYADQRSAPRARPPSDKMVCVQRDGQAMGEMFNLFDLSQGGLGFLTTEKDHFEVGQTLNILGFDDKNFEAPMVVVVRAIRETDESATMFKIGCSFQG